LAAVLTFKIENKLWGNEGINYIT